MRAKHTSKIATRHGLYALVAGLVLGALPAKAQEKDLSVIQDWLQYSDAPNALYHHLADQAYDLLEARATVIADLKSARQWRRRQADVRATLLDIVGPFPEKTPLNPRITGLVQKPGYRMEKLVYQSLPGFHVTAALFIPDNIEGKAPAVLFCSGHTLNGFRSEVYQTIILNLVKKGFVVLAFDPVSQGERSQYFDAEKGERYLGGPTKEHSYAGAQCFIAGRSQARYMIWDGIRSLDYLISRPEVDPDRIGITGRSGGGTQSAYIAAFDNRVLAAAPENYITSFSRLMESIAPQDAEQNFYHGIARGIDHADLLEVRAPKPALLIATTRDFFSIQGARETWQEVSRAYKILGKPGNFSMVEDDTTHASTRKDREALYAFFSRHLNHPCNTTDEEVALLTPEELQVTETGQVVSSFEGETIHSLNKAETEVQLESLGKSRQSMKRHLMAVKNAAADLSGLKPPAAIGKVVFTGRYRRPGYAVEKYFVPGEGDYVIPFLLMVPEGEGPFPAVIYLHPQGKATQAHPGGELEALVRQGTVVLAPDLVGIGELGSEIPLGDSYIGGTSYNMWFASILVGRSIVGIHASDVSRLVQVLMSRGDIDAGKISALARGEMSSVLLHVAALEPSIKRVALVEPLLSFRSLVMHQKYKPSYIMASVAGALTAYDLPDLAAALAPRPLLMVNPVDQVGNPVDQDRLGQELAVVQEAYTAMGAAGKLDLHRSVTPENLENILAGWIGQ